MGKDVAITETHKEPMLLASIDPACAFESTAAAFRTKDVAELTREYVETTLIDEYNAKEALSDDGKRTRNFRRKKKKQSRVAQNTQILAQFRVGELRY